MTLSNKQLASPNLEQIFTNSDDLQNCEMAVLLIKLLPFMEHSAQEFSLANICRLCVANIRNQLKACKRSLLLNLIDLLNYHNKFNLVSIGMNFCLLKTLYFKINKLFCFFKRKYFEQYKS